MKKFTILLSLSIFAFSALTDTSAQTPQYYNFNNGTETNVFPFAVTAGKLIQWLFNPNEFNQPSPLPAGNMITKVYFFMQASATTTFTNLTVRMGQTTLTTLPIGVFYTGQMDTVYFRASVTLTSTATSWMSITLDRPFVYNPAQSLVIEVTQCSATNASMSVRQTPNMVPTPRRTYGNGPCPYTYSGQNASLVNCGLDVISAGPVPRFYNTAWCPGTQYPNIPGATIYNECAWIGDTLYMHTPDGAGNATTTMVKYILSTNSWSAAVAMPLANAKTQGTLTSAAGKLYYIGGGVTPGGGGSPDIYEFNPASGFWTLKTPLPGSTQGHSAVNWGDSVIFVIMGPWNTPAANCYFYRIGSNTTGTTTSFTGIPTRSHASGLWGNKIYVAGGFGTTFTKQFYIGTIGSNASTITWAAGPPFLSVPKAGLGGVAVGDRFYLVGGNNSIGSISSDTTMIWFINAGVWGFFPGIKPVAVHNVEAAVTYKLIGDTVKIFCPGGSSGSGTTLNFDVIACGLTVTGIEPVVSQIPDEYALIQNYPNPFNPTTNIKYQIPKNSFVRIVVYNILGDEVSVLLNEFKQRGEYEIKFDGSNLASGLYFYKLETGEFTETKKMLLLK